MTCDSSSTDAIEAAAQALMRGELVAFPTETVYGLGADADSSQAVAQIYQIKGRPSNHPVIVHLACAQDMAVWAQDLPDQAWQLARAFWPGPLTLIVKSAAGAGSSVSGGQPTVGLRCPSHPVAQALLVEFARLKRQAGAPRAGVAAPSANRFGRVSPTRAEHVRQEFEQAIRDGLIVLQGGDSEVGIESTIVDLSQVADGGSVALLRPGAITADQVQAVLGQPVASASAQSPRVSGSLKAHYAPSTPLALVATTDLLDVITQWLQQHEGRLAIMSRSHAPAGLSQRVVWLTMPADPTTYAQQLYGTLRSTDEYDLSAILCEQVPSESAWDAVRDRITRAAAAFTSLNR